MKTKNIFLLTLPFLLFFSFFSVIENIKGANLKATCPYVAYYAGKEGPINLKIKLYDDDSITIDLYRDGTWESANVKSRPIGYASVLDYMEVAVYLSDKASEFAKEYKSVNGCPIITSQTASNEVWLHWGDKNDEVNMYYASKSNNPIYENIVSTKPTESTSKTTCEQRCSNYVDSWATAIRGRCISDCESCVSKCTDNSCKSVCYNSNYVETPTAVTQTKTCKYSIKTNVIPGIDGIDVQFNMYSDVSKEFCVRVSGSTTYSCSERMSSSTVVNDEKAYFGVLAKNLKNTQAYLFTIKGKEIPVLYKNVVHANGTFTCPDSNQLYIVNSPTYTYTSQEFYLTTDAEDAKANDGQNLIDGSLADNGEGENWEKELPDPDKDIIIDDKPSKTGCGMITNEMADKINWFLDIIKYGGVLLAIGLGMLDFAKAVFSDEADANKKAGQKFIKRIIAAAIIFIVPLIIQFLLNIVEIDGVDKNSPFCIQLNS